MKNKKLLMTLGCLGLALATQADIVTFTFQEHGPNLDLGTSSIFTEGAFSITASGFDTSGNPAHLFSKFTSGDPSETGLGLVQDSLLNDEIDPSHFIQLDLSSLKATTTAAIGISSVQTDLGETAIVYATKTPGSLAGAIPIQTLTANGSVDITSYVNAGDFIDVTAGKGNVLIVTLSACVTTCSLTAPTALPVCGSVNNQLSGPAGMAHYLWTIISSTAPGWAITSGGDTQTVTYTAGSTGNATFQLLVVSADGCASTCQVTFGCAMSQGGCRVTGGSNHQLNNSQGPCINTPPPSFVSHGGQVGASHSGETEFTPYSLCISGEWQHNRHLKGNSLVGTLHASGNGSTHQFDSLLCACLPCSPGDVGLVGDVCNPTDRNCGPLPSKAPANKICFSGVGDYTFLNGPKPLKAVFRVDIEDRSEGNSPSSNPPPDRYRIRIWVLGTTCRPYGPDSVQGMALRLAVSADASKIGTLATTEQLKNPKVAGAPDIDDGGDMTQGNHQIHPETGSTCP